jgi:tetratricopeptide (TPR) repeat protein
VEWNQLVAEAWERASHDDPEPTVRFFAGLASERPEDPRAVYEHASALDFAGREAEAAPLYEQSLALGLDGEEERRALVQYGSTLRNLGRLDDSVRVLEEARRRFPQDLALPAFLALTLADADRGREAVADLLDLLVDHADSPDLALYAAPLHRYAEELRAPR